MFTKDSRKREEISIGLGYSYQQGGCKPITIPKHEPIKKVYVEMVKQIVESEAKSDENVE
ncbi:hypothetical protein C823_003585 [Eubacterium plexicaudatum ASF492]|uniref:Uncharacterized protein n=1 Tax=Eubacterium plexicaudatum ASF492 TaxID=1235802 RepID=N2AQM6_9FIRM|nr:hypothetical protein C823_003585 [Eubacterium plexicaudatum ASF492]